MKEGFQLPLCIEIAPYPKPQSITLPGGISLEHINLIELIQPALTPLVPMFNIIDTIVAVFNCIKAIPDSIGPPPDPTVIKACLADLTEKVDDLLGLIPQLSLPLLVVGLLDLVIDALQKARTQVLHLQSQMVQILGVIDRATELDDAGLMSIAQCARANVAQEAANVGQSLASLGKLIGLINLFMAPIGGPEIPDLSDLAGRPLDQFIEPLDVLVEAMQTARSAIPLP